MKKLSHYSTVIKIAACIGCLAVAGVMAALGPGSAVLAAADDPMLSIPGQNATPTETSTPTQTSTPTPIVSETPTPTITQTPTATASASPGITGTSTLVLTVSATASLPASSTLTVETGPTSIPETATATPLIRPTLTIEMIQPTQTPALLLLYRPIDPLNPEKQADIPLLTSILRFWPLGVLILVWGAIILWYLITQRIMD